ncbi:MAG: FkbM family methyltransferase [Candidatus Accumulibacter cognatus]|uniref:FkbM family methyltransferase n=3 Tax=Candidatus Accumulibacter TaxID=327159 RepID=A0A7D5SB27_9PROT|nr:FkbM family methyltransferase [Accumulibacter sp.]MBL8399477.1 FkbM family methyltransferase [Accumulibacter sp.]MCC2867906.1 FkbM family methyltransferase [Candidatus Accumulibacter phosphatis]QLH52336.1 MAG: FkbM family methyltransferase [Candidatus Accumulibacter cognatus]
MTNTTSLTLLDGVRIVTPDSLELITPYVLREQQDWFEDEIKFLRHLLKPGQKVIDIGANYGVYALCMAKAVGSTGHVWAFEPSSSTASLLAEGIAANSFAQVTLVQSALSSASGTARLSRSPHSELNALVHDLSATTETETVSLVTLDECLETYCWQDIEVIKIDAEGEEANILKGGERFFAQLSPLVQYEIKAGPDLHMHLIEAFAALGYTSYRLVPGLDLLVPFDPEAQIDGFLLNLFCCKPDRAARLAARGVLLDSAGLETAGEPIRELLGIDGSLDVHYWQHAIIGLPYGTQLANEWEVTMNSGGSEEVAHALSLYTLSRDSSLPASARFLALEASFRCLETLCGQQASHLRLASLARVARDYGSRSLAVNALAQLCTTILQQQQVDTSEPFLAPGERFDSIVPGEVIGDWVLAAVLEELERLSSFSSFYTGASALQRLHIIRELGFGSSEMARRLSLLQERLGLPA